ncbi:transmembrane protein 154 isoform X1 [Zootoca vivipara]|uniref:transmembrane protein 154 isoform X1 n=1 Tax=Zootoca vivipara TaxID=8524 RepID=UPI0015913AA8|nr:transmembrane protein 154 isoform X1 [Zootoca vivipara]
MWVTFICQGGASNQICLAECLWQDRQQLVWNRSLESFGELLGVQSGRRKRNYCAAGSQLRKPPSDTSQMERERDHTPVHEWVVLRSESGNLAASRKQELKYICKQMASDTKSSEASYTLNGSTTALADEEYSGHGLTIPVTTEVPVLNTLGSPTPVMILTTSDQGVQTATTFAEAENTKMGTTASAEMEDLLHPALIYGIPAAMLLVLVVLLVVFIARRRKQKPPKQEELASESCKSPIFEEDTPSVMEIEMEELDKWMNSLKRNTECEYLPPVKEEKDCNASPSDCES